MAALPPAIAPRAFWVSLPRLLGGAYPGDADQEVSAQKLAALLEVGVTNVVSLMEADEVDHVGRPFHPYAPALERCGVRVERFAIRDVITPTVNWVAEILDYIDSALAGGRVVYVHCWGGRGRTGVVLGCWMVRHGWAAPEDAIAELNRLRSRCADSGVPAPDTHDQRDRIRGWAPGR